MLSRVADAIFWTSRYVERAENVARFVNVNLDLMLDTPTAVRVSWEPLIQTTGDMDWYKKEYSDFSPESVTKFLTFNRAYSHSIFSSVRAARENARTVREVISREMWAEINALYLMVSDARREERLPEDMAGFYEQVKAGGIHYAGATDATLSHGPAWHFSRLGRMLERADKTSRILDVKYYILQPTYSDATRAVDQVGWTALLNSASALQMFRQQRQAITPQRVARFLLLDAEFPRSIRHCVHQMQESLHLLTGNPTGGYSNEAERLVGQLRARLDFVDIQTIMASGLHEYLDDLQSTLNNLVSPSARCSSVTNLRPDRRLPLQTNSLCASSPSRTSLQRNSKDNGSARLPHPQD
jgi:uncharacterized alpha-E superfamily protein